MKRFVITLCLVLAFSQFANAQPDTEVYLLNLIYKNGEYVVERPVSVSKKNPGYDNQPSFSGDGQFLY